MARRGAGGCLVRIKKRGNTGAGVNLLGKTNKQGGWGAGWRGVTVLGTTNKRGSGAGVCRIFYSRARTWGINPFSHRFCNLPYSKPSLA